MHVRLYKQTHARTHTCIYARIQTHINPRARTAVFCSWSREPPARRSTTCWRHSLCVSVEECAETSWALFFLRWSSKEKVPEPQTSEWKWIKVGPEESVSFLPSFGASRPAASAAARRRGAAAKLLLVSSKMESMKKALSGADQHQG